MSYVITQPPLPPCQQNKQIHSPLATPQRSRVKDGHQAEIFEESERDSIQSRDYESRDREILKAALSPRPCSSPIPVKPINLKP
ncbi:hypothetical protein AVEN_55602-1 [Araneus ventricosus]|uniref:Uncharacterized protein n=1 Tax=Araneus ventricosus TaxID=182803 RepID=A0A4Y2PCP8_ARAVE|nr:hypothetical protein AVEN_55602-1 [Araneus ventricosus]